MSFTPVRPYFRLAVIFFILIVAAELGPAALSAPAATQSSLYREGLRQFQSLNGSSRAKYRDAWMRVHGYFQEAVNLGPDTVTGAKALYYMARTWEGLGENSLLRSDFIRAADNFQRAANRFPKGHSWIDDCLFHKAEIRARRLGDTAGAIEDLKLILSRHPGGDQAGKARDLLAKLGSSAPVERNKSKSSAKASSAGAGSDYQKALSGFKRLCADPRKYQRGDFLAVIERFGDLALDPGGPYAAKSLYFMGFTCYELGQVSGRESDFRRAVEFFGQAADSFPAGDSWIDDALFRRAKVLKERLNEPDQAYADLLKIVHEHAKGDMAAEARAMLAEMDGERARALPAAKDELAMGAPEITASRDGPATLTNIRYRADNDYTRIVLDLSKSAAFSSRELPPDPDNNKSHRMFVDLSDTRLDPGVEHEINIDGGFLSRVRSAQNTGDTTRVVLDFTEKQKYHVFALENPYRVVIDVFAERSADSAARSVSVTQNADAGREPGEQEKRRAADVLSQLGLTVRTVMIDPGHGGRDPGAVRYTKTGGRKSLDLIEKEVTLRLAKMLGSKLEALGYKVIYTRNTDEYVSLEDRAVTANLKGADLFISLHANANTNSKVRGFETYYLGKARNDLVLKLAAKENGVDPAKISDTQKIVMDLVHSFKIEESKGLAGLVQKNTVGSLKRHYGDVRDNGARSAPFFVLIGAKMPAILIEVGYTTHPTEAERLKSEKYLSRVADGVIQGIEAYIKNIQMAGT